MIDKIAIFLGELILSGTVTLFFGLGVRTFIQMCREEWKNR